MTLSDYPVNVAVMLVCSVQ